jgi:hypothetical protein
VPGTGAAVRRVLLLRPLNAKGKLRLRERAPFEPKFSSSLMLRRIFAPAAWR